MTNFEKIKEEMTVEKMAKGMADYYDCDICPCKEFCETLLGLNRCSETFEKWLKKDVDILDEVEKEYLKKVLAPWLKNHNIVVIKWNNYINTKEWLDIDISSKSGKYLGGMSFPNFSAGTMYTGMKLEKEYTVEELGLR